MYSNIHQSYPTGPPQALRKCSLRQRGGIQVSSTKMIIKLGLINRFYCKKEKKKGQLILRSSDAYHIRYIQADERGSQSKESHIREKSSS